MIINKIELDGSRDAKEYPFPYRGTGSSHCPRRLSTSQDVRYGLTRVLKYTNPPELNVLEIGAGHNSHPSQSIKAVGGKVVVLDADWNKTHTDLEIEIYDDPRTLNADKVIFPTQRGIENGVPKYLGDVALLNHKRSQLRAHNISTILFWGSIDYAGVCSSIEDSETPYRWGVTISHRDRLAAPLPRINSRGSIISVAQHLNGHRTETAKSIKYSNANLTEQALFWASRPDKPAASIGIIRVTPEIAAMRKHAVEGEELQPALRSNPAEMIRTDKRYKLFTGEDEFNAAQEHTGLTDDELDNPGIIDAIYVTYL